MHLSRYAMSIIYNITTFSQNMNQIKRYIAQVSKEKENIPKISIENVIKFQVYVRQNSLNQII